MAAFRHLGLFTRKFTRCPSYNLDDVFGPPLGFFPEIWMPPEYALAMYWRVKKWRFSHQIEWSEVNADAAIFNWEVEREFTVGQASFLSQDQRMIFGPPDVQGPIVSYEDILSPELDANIDEQKLICGVDPAEYETTYIPDDYFGGDPVTVQVSVNKHFSCSANIISRLATSGTAGPSAGTNTRVEISWGWNQSPVYIRNGVDGVEMLPTIYYNASTFRWTEIKAYDWPSIGQFGNTPLGQYGTFVYSLLGKTFSAPIYGWNSRYDQAGFSNTLSVYSSLEAIEYWPYDPEDGFGPIYDKDTGAQIRPFPNL